MIVTVGRGRWGVNFSFVDPNRKWGPASFPFVSSNRVWSELGLLPLQTSIPAVSSRHGSLLAVVPGVLGLMAFSPELDACGNPWRAVHFCQVRHGSSPAPAEVPNDLSGLRRSWYPRFSCTLSTSGRLSGRFWPTGSGRPSQRLVLLLLLRSTSLLADVQDISAPLQGYQIMNVLLAAFKGDVQALRRWRQPVKSHFR